jgi:hypothetical protein
MMIEAAQRGGLSRTVTGLYRRFFARLLEVDADETEWEGWAYILTQLAAASLIASGRRGKGLIHDDAMSVLNQLKRGDESVLATLEEHYGIRGVKGSRAALQKLKEANILTWSEGSWRFAHDRYEEYFAAVHLVQVVGATQQWPSLTSWLESEAKQREFLDVLEFAAELDQKRALVRHQPSDHPQLWRSSLHGLSASVDPPGASPSA